ncbi:MAG TPA: ABC transporter permease [Gammaproteobacteria bacterium]|nr:ABC transporter permease [Gammaproteobacteria bacterium]
MGSLAAIVAKDLRLLARDRVALVFILIAPIVVICVAGFSLASFYGAGPSGQTAYELPLVDEDGGELAAKIGEQLTAEPRVHVRRVATRAEAERLVRDKRAGSALVIPAGTREALARGESPRVLLFVDPVKYLERLNVRLEVLRARDELAAAERSRVVTELAAQRAALREQLEALDATLARGREQLAAAEQGVQGERARAAAEVRAAFESAAARVRSDVARQVDAQLEALGARVDAEVAARAAAVAAPAREYLAALADARTKFEAWFAELQRLADRRADRIPPPPEFPEPPPGLTRALDEPPPRVTLPADLGIRIELPAPSLPSAAPPEPAVEIERPSIAIPDLAIPGAALAVEEVSVSGGPPTINTFDQNVPGFSVTFLLLGMLLGVSLGLLDERDWGTLDRVRALPVAASNILLGKLASRFAVGFAQMLVLFAVGYLLFDISLGPQPWALLLPIAGVVFAGTAFGLIVAAGARTRDAVLPLGSIVIVTMAAIGGCWWPIDLEPRWMRTLALAFPTTWAMDAFNDLMIRRRGVEAAYVPTGMLLAYGLAYLGVSLALFRRRMR